MVGTDWNELFITNIYSSLSATDKSTLHNVHNNYVICTL